MQQYQSIAEASSFWGRKLQPDPEFYLGQAQRGLDDAKIALRHLEGQRANQVIEIQHEINMLKQKIEGLK